MRHLKPDQNYEGYVKSKVTYEDGSLVNGNEIANKSVLVVGYEVDKEMGEIKFQTNIRQFLNMKVQI